MKRLHAVFVALLLAVSSTPAIASPRYGDWSSPTNVGNGLEGINTAAFEFMNDLSRDGLEMYFQRAAVNGIGEDLWVAHRASVDAPWSAPVRMPATINDAVANDRGATLSPDGHWLFFASDRDGGLGGYDIWISWRAHVHDDLGWLPAWHPGAPLNSPYFDSGPAFLEDENGMLQLFMTSSRASGQPGQQGTDMYAVPWDGADTFGVPVPLVELNSPARDEPPYFRHDGREVFFQSNRGGNIDIWTSTRATTRDPWSTPVNVTSVNTPASDTTPVLSWDGRTLYIGSGRPGAAGADVYVTTREKTSSAP